MDKNGERSLSGSPIWRHKKREKPFEGAVGIQDSIEAISDHIERFIGPIEMVFHEVVSDLVHIDLHWVKASDKFPFHVLVTSGMSDRPMATPEGVAGCQYAELLITLPPDWPVSLEAFQDDGNYWPLRMVKVLARMPHEFDTWLWLSHTVGNGEPPEPFHDSTDLLATLIAPPVLLPGELYVLKLRPEKKVTFFSAVPIYLEELRLKMTEGVGALYDRFDMFNVDEVIDPNRPNTCDSRWRKDPFHEALSEGEMRLSKTESMERARSHLPQDLVWGAEPFSS